MDWLNDPNLSDSEKVKMYLQNKGRDQAEAQNEERQSGLGWAQFAAGIGDAFAGRSAAQTAQNFDKIRANIKDQTVGEYDRKKKSAVDDFDSKRKIEQIGLKDDPNSEESKMARTLALDMGMDPKLAGTMTATQFENLSPYLKAKYEAKIREMDRRELRAERQAVREEKAAEKSIKDKELSVAQAKQMGLYQMGQKAEQQYAEAVKAGKTQGYDPTSHADFIDNTTWMPNLVKNKHAIAAESAQATWVENFLRDASGAAIPPSERMAYAKDYFPQPGDTEKVVANKAALRKQKMENALLGAGREGMRMAEQMAPAQAQQASSTVRVKDPKGVIRVIPADKLQAAISKGATLIDNVAGQ